jgi:DNA-binding MurR/RpiR family transcriptional regulator
MQTIRKLTDDEKKFLEERRLMKSRISGFKKQSRRTQENENHTEESTEEEKSSNESEQEQENEENEEDEEDENDAVALIDETDDFWMFGKRFSRRNF